MFKSYGDAFLYCQGGDPNISPMPRFTSGNTSEYLRYFEEHDGKPQIELEVKHRPEDPNRDCMVACIIEWGHSQKFEKWSNHPAEEHECRVKVSDFLCMQGLKRCS